MVYSGTDDLQSGLRENELALELFVVLQNFFTITRCETDRVIGLFAQQRAWVDNRDIRSGRQLPLFLGRAIHDEVQLAPAEFHRIDPDGGFS